MDRPNRQKRRKEGKSDSTDAVAAARAALSGEATTTPKSRNGRVEEMRVLLVARRSARAQRSQSLNQLRHLVLCAPEPIQARFKDRPKAGLVTEAANMRPREGSDPIVYTTLLVIRSLARRIQGLDAEKQTIDDALRLLIEETAPSLLDSTESASTAPPPCWSPLETTPTGCIGNAPGLTSAESLLSRPAQAKHPTGSG